MTSHEAFIQLDPEYTLCWDRSNSVRVGFDRAVARAQASAPEAQRLLGTLIAGTPAADLEEPTLSAKHGEAGRTLLSQLMPALVTRDAPPSLLEPEATRSAIRAQIHDDGRSVPALITALESQWLCRFERGHAPPELVVQVLRFFEPLERTRRWLSEGIPHLLVRFTDDFVRIGPLVSASGSPCHSCEVLGLVDDDPVLPALAAQLYGTVPSTETTIVAGIAGAIAAQYVDAWKDGETRVHDTQVVLPVSRGRVSGIPRILTIRPHAECACTISTVSSLSE